MRNKTIKRIIVSIFMMTIIMCLGITSANATDIKINGETFSNGDTLTYIADFQCDEAFAGINITVKYPVEVLELDKESVNVPNLGSMAIANTDTPGEIRFTATDIGSGFDFTEEKLLVSATFKVKDGATTGDIQMDVMELINTDLEDIDIDRYFIAEKLQKGNYDGTVVNPISGEEYIEEESTSTPTDNKNSVVIFTVVIAVVLIGSVSVIVAVKNKKSGTNNN
ncbi:MAG: hypothetical protein UH239_10375 [Acutalibacteraceae bacterium]|nr:hypothetical protein [Acutalibacteraceae bacterium]